MERKIAKQLAEWKNALHRKPLLLKGARQVGKTWSLLDFGKKHYKNVLYFNFESNKDLHGIFDRDLAPGRLLNELSAYAGQSILENESLIIFDEIQACERALTSLKYFEEEAPAFHVAAAGSLLGVAVKRNNYSFPVGKVDILSMYPLDFDEYLLATGNEKLLPIIEECYENDSPCSLHNKLLDIYKQYVFTGGMPKVVHEYASSGDLNLVVAEQKNIANSYVADMAKYADPQETVRIMSAYNSLPSQLAKENKKFQYKIIKTGARASNYESAIDWLEAAGLVIRCEKVSSARFPLKTQAERSFFKLYMHDTGLLCALMGIPPNAFLSDLPGMDYIKGAIAENYVATVLKANAYNPYYWESQGKAEVDFLIQTRSGDIIPVEVKSSENVRTKSLQQFVSRYKPPLSIRISAKNFGFENRIKSVPFYAATCIRFAVI
jgi:uncharacterized protein